MAIRGVLLPFFAASLLVHTSPDSIRFGFSHLERGMVRPCEGGLGAKRGTASVAGQDLDAGKPSRLLAALRSRLIEPQLHVMRGGADDDMEDGEHGGRGDGAGGGGQKRPGMRLRMGMKHSAKRACLTTPLEEEGDGGSESESLDAESPHMGSSTHTHTHTHQSKTHSTVSNTSSAFSLGACHGAMLSGIAWQMKNKRCSTQLKEQTLNTPERQTIHHTRFTLNHKP